ncbi:hypothetical protein V8F20_011450 [Naviculisporaceae sp. PSN 640]
MLRETCMLFVDNSNLWIEAQKFAASGGSHMPKLKDNDRDPRVRIDTAKLVELLCCGRIQGPSFVYGSRPPPTDSIWDAFKKNGFEAHIYSRARNGKEKEVDTSMVVKMSSKSTDLDVRAELGGHDAKERKNNTIFVIVSGDRDMLPAVKHIVVDCGIRVELWAWNSNLSQEYLMMANDNELFSIRFLDSIFVDICFTSFRSTRMDKSVNQDTTMVLRDIAECDEDFVHHRLANIGRLFRTTRLYRDSDFYVDFTPPEGKALTIDFNTIIAEARSLVPHISISSFYEHKVRFQKDARREVTIASLRGYGDSEGHPEPEAVSVSPVTDPEDRDSQLSPVSIAKKRDATVMADESWITEHGESGRTGARFNELRKRQRRVAGQEQDQTYFTHRRANENYKTAMCENSSPCYRGQKCWYAHSEEELRCLNCKKTGHSRGDASKCASLRQ